MASFSQCDWTFCLARWSCANEMQSKQVDMSVEEWNASENEGLAKSKGLTSDRPWIDAPRVFFLLLKVMPREKVAAFWLAAMWSWEMFGWSSSRRRLERSGQRFMQRIRFEVSDMAAMSSTGHFQIIGPFWLKYQQTTCWWTLGTNEYVLQYPDKAWLSCTVDFRTICSFKFWPSTWGLQVGVAQFLGDVGMRIAFLLQYCLRNTSVTTWNFLTLTPKAVSASHLNQTGGDMTVYNSSASAAFASIDVKSPQVIKVLLTLTINFATVLHIDIAAYETLCEFEQECFPQSFPEVEKWSLSQLGE